MSDDALPPYRQNHSSYNPGVPNDQENQIRDLPRYPRRLDRGAVSRFASRAHFRANSERGLSPRCRADLPRKLLSVSWRKEGVGAVASGRQTASDEGGDFRRGHPSGEQQGFASHETY